MITDPYFSTDRCVDRLVKQCEKHGNIIVGFDFDDTIFDCHNEGFKYDKMIDCLRKCKDMNFVMVLYSAQDTQDKINKAVEKCRELGFEPDFINWSPIMSGTTKPFFNILLDDKSGLEQSYNILMKFIKRISTPKKIDLLELMSERVHILWMKWAVSLMSEEQLTKEREDRWYSLLVPYDALSESEKEKDRVIAKQLMKGIDL